jgi:hypothetical protein
MCMISIGLWDGWITSRRAARTVAVVVAVLSSAAMAAPTVLDFEDLPAGTTVTAQYGPRGVVFLNHFLDTDPAARSGTRVLRTASLASEIFTPIPLAITFTSAQARVKLFAGSTNVALNGTLTAFDAADNVVVQDGPKLVNANVFTTMFEVIDPDATPSITRAELRLENGIYFAIDDLEFEGQPPASPPPTPPVVQITSPPNGAELDVSTLDIAGTVTGEGLLSPVKLTVLFARPPESTAPPFTSDLALTGTGTTRQFSLPGFTGVPLGPIKVTVTAENFAAQQGTASITFTNLLAAIRNRFTAEGGAATLGAFRFGLFLDGCKVAVYEQGAISTDGAGVTRLIRGNILAKWLSLRGAFNQTGFFGCPTGDERDGPGGSRAQDFQRGRIYSHPTIGVFSVPTVFVEAIDKNGGEEATGIPIMEPTSSPGAMQTWLFQRFTRPNPPVLSPRANSTLEIRGTPPVLWIERQGGELNYPRDVNFSATLWESFPCSGTLGPCAVDPPEGTPLWESTPCRCAQEPCTIEPPFPPPGPSEPIANAGDLFCFGTTYADCGVDVVPPSAGCEVGRVPEWSPILGHHISTPLFGIAVESAMAGEDNPLTHQYVYYCPERGCPSDWNVAIFPIGPQRGIAPHTSFVAENTYVELEYETSYAKVPHIFMDRPFVGDLFFAAGRWIIDCGHTPYRSELHPIFMFAKMKSEEYQGHLATRCDIWVNGWYPGDPIEFDIFPPPRPSPDSVLVVNKPVDEDASFNVNLEFCVQPAGAANHAHLRFTAALREDEVTGAGEMIWQTRRAYMGQWFLYWSQ